MLPGQFVERAFRFLVRQRKTDDDVLAAELAPESFRRPFLRLRAARSFDPAQNPTLQIHLRENIERRVRKSKMPPILAPSLPPARAPRAARSAADLSEYFIATCFPAW